MGLGKNKAQSQPGELTSRSRLVIVLLLASSFVLGLCVSWNKRQPEPKRLPLPAQPPQPAVNDRVSQGRPGPWGKLECVRIAIEMPGEFVSVPGAAFPPPRWFFSQYTTERLTALFESAGLTERQRAVLLRPQTWEVTPDGIRVRPDEATVLTLSAAARRAIYEVLARSPENAPQADAVSFKPAYLPERLERSGLSPSSLDLLKNLLYPHGSLLLFADLNSAVRQLPDEAEKIRFIKTVTRKSTFLAKLRVDQNSDIDALVNYWGFEGRAKDLRPLLESLARVPGGCALDIAHLLPPLARRRIYTYPVPPADPKAPKPDCHWTSLNFLSDQPDDRFSNPADAMRVIDQEYQPVHDSPRLGDVVFLWNVPGTILHSAAFVADNVVFTKNGANLAQPWILMTMEDMTGFYQAFYHLDQPLKVTICRRRQS